MKLKRHSSVTGCYWSSVTDKFVFEYAILQFMDESDNSSSTVNALNPTLLVSPKSPLKYESAVQHVNHNPHCQVQNERKKTKRVARTYHEPESVESSGTTSKLRLRN